jgi:hypothetical protein
MTALLKTFLSVTFFLTVYAGYSQVNDEKIRLQVLEKGIIDSIFVFGKWKKNGGTETNLQYLGQVRTVHGQIFKIVNSIRIWGLSSRATSRILVFNDKNQYVGNYYVTLISDLPTSLINGKLIFKNTNGYCDKNLTTIIDLKKGLPKQFFRKCKGKYGDIYSLQYLRQD